MFKFTRFTHSALLSLLVLNLVLAACGPAGVATLTLTAAPTIAPTQTPADEPTATDARTYPEGILAAIEALSASTGISADQIHVATFEAVEWGNACLGLAQPDEACAEVITPGYRVTLRAGEAEYVFHTNADGSAIRQQAQSPAVQAAVNALAQLKGIIADEIMVVSVDAAEWSDSCLGVDTPSLVCLTVITPGYRILLSAGGEQFEFHTNESGSAVRLATP